VSRPVCTRTHKTTPGAEEGHASCRVKGAVPDLCAFSLTVMLLSDLRLQTSLSRESLLRSSLLGRQKGDNSKKAPALFASVGSRAGYARWQMCPLRWRRKKRLAPWSSLPVAYLLNRCALSPHACARPSWQRRTVERASGHGDLTDLPLGNETTH